MSRTVTAKKKVLVATRVKPQEHADFVALCDESYENASRVLSAFIRRCNAMHTTTPWANGEYKEND